MKNILIFCVLLTVTISCKKDEVTREELLTNSPWKLTESVYTPALQLEGGFITNVYEIMYDCEKDDLWKFNPGGTFVWNEGASDCDGVEGESLYPEVFEMGMWAFSQDESKIFGYNMLSYLNYREYNILKLTSSELQLEFNFYIDAVEPLDSIQNVVNTYVHP